MLGDRLLITPKASPSSSPRPSPVPENRKDHPTLDFKDPYANINEESIVDAKSDHLTSANVPQVETIQKTISNSLLRLSIPDMFSWEENVASLAKGASKKLGVLNNANTEQLSVLQGHEGSDRRPSNVDLSQTDLAKSESSSTTSSKEKKTKKRSSWFNTFYPTYKSRSQDFKRIFKDVPDDERLVVDYSCAVQKEILVHGRLYVTQNYICFYANIFGWGTNIVLRWKDVAAITKEKTAIVIPNAVLICTKTEKYFFTSFVARDKVYLMLFRLWQNALLDRQMSNQEMWQWVHKSYGAELGLTSDDEDYIAPGTEEDKSGNATSPDILTEADIVTGGSANSSGKEKGEDRESLPNDVNSINPKKSTVDAQMNADVSDSDLSDMDAPSQLDIQNINCDYSHEGRQLLDEVLPIHVDQLFTLLFTSSKFYLDFHACRKTTDLVQTPWTQNSANNSKSRVVNLTMALNQAIGPKTSQVTETQVMAPCSRPGVLYSVTTESISGGVPYADSFYIETHYCIKKISDKQSSLAVYAQIKFKKSVWGLVKGMIEKNCWSGLEDYFLALSKALQTEGEEYIPEMKRRTKRKRKLHSSPRSDVAITKLGVSPIPTDNNTLSVVTSQKVTLVILIVLCLLLVLNVVLYRKLWILEEEKQPFNILHSEIIKNPPATHDEWLKLFKKQDKLHNQEMLKWHQMLKAAINTLKQTESILLTLQNSTNSKLMNNIKIEDLMEEGRQEGRIPKTEL
ncbi:hypothetical protein WA026_011625 [Henosepilachna vigintioctopunctata]|uniref:VASt domain-containing protein n=1 Tax=Henosepilachna vigintioctopunctata TaxID=420089 RepID=A0AAW1TM50_9CUCU